MTQEEKQLLLKDLCARLPYGVIVHNEEGYEGHLNSINQTIFGIELDVNITSTRRVDFQLDTCKPYLRPMSSMTEEEEKEIQKINWQFCKPNNVLLECFVGNADDGYCSTSQMVGILDYLNAHHFDYRGLIEKGLALAAPEDMYKTK